MFNAFSDAAAGQVLILLWKQSVKNKRLPDKYKIAAADLSITPFSYFIAHLLPY